MKVSLQLLIVVFLLFTFTSVGTNPTIDSLKQELRLVSHDTSRVMLWNALASAFAANYDHLDSAIHFGQLAYDKAIAMNYPVGKAKGAYNLAYAYDLAGKVNDALDYYERARQHYSELNDKEWVATCMRGKGIACYFQGDYGKALEYYHEAIEYAKEHQLLEQAANSMVNLGVVYRILENYDQAIEIYRENIPIRKQLKDSVRLAKVYNNIGVVYTYKNKLDSAITYLDSSVIIYQLLNDSFNLGTVYVTCGDAYLEAGGDLSEARSYLEKGYAIMKRYDDNVIQSKALLYLGQVEEKSKQYTKARDYLYEGLQVLEGSELDEIRRDISTVLSRVEHQLGNHAAAFQFLSQSYALNDSIVTKERVKYTKEMEVKYETEKKEREIVELNAEKEIAAFKLSNAKKVTAILIAALVVFGVLLLILYRLNQKIKAQRNLISDALVEKEKLLDLLKKAQAKIIQSEKMASLGQLTAGIAHEINNPTNFISTSAQSLQADMNDLNPILDLINTMKEGADEEAVRKLLQLRDQADLPLVQKEMNELLKGVEQGVSRTSDIIKGLKHFSHPGTTDKEQVNVHNNLDTVLSIMQNQLKGKAEVLKNYDLNIPEIYAMRSQLNQVLINLFSNALDAIQEKYGEEGENHGKIWLTTGQYKSEIFISIKDNGDGISMTDRSKVFDPFYTTKEVGKGVGLGLAISYGIIDEHQGRIEIRGEEGEGAEFVVWLPKEKD